MPDNNGDSSNKHMAVATEESTSPEARFEAVAPKADEKEGKKGSRARAVLKNHPRLILVILLAVLLGVGYVVRSAFLDEDTDDAQINGHIMPLSARINGYVMEVPVIEGQLVHAGDVLVTIDPKDYKIARDQAQATFASAQASAAGSLFNVPITSVSTQSILHSAGTAVVNAQAGLKAVEQNFESAKATLDQAEANSKRSDADLVRYEQLVAKEDISRQQYDAAVARARADRAAVASATAGVQAAEQAVRQAQGKLLQSDDDLPRPRRSRFR
jgi:membrane fusion protein (multidrug efflux system)